MSASDISGITNAHRGSRASVSDIQDAPLTSSTDSPVKKFPLRGKENQFTDKGGHRHHSYETEKAPYPLSYDKDFLEL
jgi:hypothetical protein